MATKAEVYAYRQFKRALDDSYNRALANLAFDGAASANWILPNDIHAAYERVWGTESYNAAYKVNGAIKGVGNIVKDRWMERTSTYVSKVAGERITEVWAYSKELYVEAVNDAILTAANEGLGTRQAATRIRKLVNKKLKGDINVSRARRIARTELTSARNYGSNQALIDAVSDGAKLRKVWRISGRNTRDAHIAADGQIRDVDQPFDVGGEQLMYPGAPNGSAENVINCMCSSLPIRSESDEALKYINHGIFTFAT